MENKQIKIQSPLYTVAQNLGADIISQNGWRVVESYTNLEEEVSNARERVALADTSLNGKIMVEGELAMEVINTALGATDLEIFSGVTVESLKVFRLRGDLCFISTLPGDEREVILSLTSAAKDLNGFVTVTDVTHGRAELRIVGPASADLLSRLCGLDFHGDHFPDMTAKQSSVAKTAQLIIRNDIGELPSYGLIGDRSLGVYLWETILQAGKSLGISPIGQAALRGLNPAGTG